ncbi:hypothetical protein J2R98_000625 [Alkalibacillus filiformis]|uniref:Uncharacterized protein n=1 Tax=Alkalibacillus filiformis TaxID=200990 RepID=A0ABU0DQU6_9BACI|nr:hypothetical protein [Alkalibacillus filiformis]MDQ0350822.1 hypothetical protein [Alkalibacillus filiformis]
MNMNTKGHEHSTKEKLIQSLGQLEIALDQLQTRIYDPTKEKAN